MSSITYFKSPKTVTLSAIFCTSLSNSWISNIYIRNNCSYSINSRVDPAQQICLVQSETLNPPIAETRRLLRDFKKIERNCNVRTIKLREAANNFIHDLS